jgi:hypothetical protein
LGLVPDRRSLLKGSFVLYVTIENRTQYTVKLGYNELGC